MRTSLSFVATIAVGLLALPGTAYAQNFFVGQNDNQITQITPSGTATTFATGLSDISALAFDAAGNLYAANRGGNSIYKISSAGMVSTFVSTGLDNPLGLTFDSSGNLYVGNYGGNYISKITPGGIVTTYASGGGLFGPGGMAFDNAGNLYVANVGDGTIREITPGGSVSLFATGFNQPNDIVFNGTDFFVSNGGANAIDEVALGGVVSTVASGGLLEFPEGLTFGSDGSLYSGDRNANYLTEITLGGTVSEFAPGVMSTSIALSSTPAAPEPAAIAFALAGLLPLAGHSLLRRYKKQF